MREIMGGEGRTTQVMIRRHFRTGKNFDAVVEIDLTHEDEVQEMMQYLNQIKPLVIVMSSRCTAGGGWSTANEVVLYAYRPTTKACESLNICLVSLSMQRCCSLSEVGTSSVSCQKEIHFTKYRNGKRWLDITSLGLTRTCA